MATVTIIETGCRGCSQCVDICPVDVFEPEKVGSGDHQIARVVRSGDCIGCLSCYYLCPSQCVEVTDVPLQIPFYRIGENVAFLERFLKTASAKQKISVADWDEAYKDVTITLLSLTHAMPAIIGKGQTAVSRRSGQLAAAHLPEAYEEKDLGGILQKLQKRFQGSFNFDYVISGTTIELNFNPCGLCSIVQEAGDQVGQAVLCRQFHDYMSGLVGAFDGNRYRHELVHAGKNCSLRLNAVL